MKSLILAITLTVGLFGFVGTASAQYRDPHANMVNDWYRRYFGRNAEPNGLASHVPPLHAGTDPDFVEAGIVGSIEYYQRAGSTPEGFILSMYRDVLGSAPTKSEMRHWLNRFVHSENRHAFAHQFLRENRVPASDPFLTFPAPGFSQPVYVPRPHELRDSRYYGTPRFRPGSWFDIRDHR